jgi:alkylation response protein AidB-like acyl-CoA dehydrogenase
MTTVAATETYKGGSWMLETTAPDAVFTPERLSEEQRMMGRTAQEFTANEVLPVLDRLEQKEWDLSRDLVRRCGELGLLGTDAPEEYGGLALDKASSMIVAEAIASSASFAVTFGAMTGLSILPLLMFGTEAQKKKYLPGLVEGEMVGAYALSESSSGSDALGARAKAARQADGSFRLTGEKMWISNCSFADVYIVFAKVDGEHFSAFIVERGFTGVSTGKEEHKMGLHGSSTAPLILQDVPVPAENLLGEVGKGHKVAFEVLNYGRFKLGAMSLGGAKVAIGQAAKYAAQRKQFGQPIANFGAIKHKIGEMVVRAYAVESLLYRTAGLIDTWMEAQSGDHAAVLRGALEEFEVESSIAKVAGSEMLDFVLDENVQIHGGNGYVADYPAERAYRDSRVNRIFEGTNEINRLLIPGRLMRKALKGDLPLIPAAKRLLEEIMSPGLGELPGDGLLEAESAAVLAFRKVALLILGGAMQKYMQRVAEEQEVLSAIADIATDLFAAESAVLRAIAAHAAKRPTAALQAQAARAYVSDAAARIEFAAKTALAAMSEGDELRTQLAALRRVLKVTPVNTVAIRRELAEQTVAKGAYPFA